MIQNKNRAENEVYKFILGSYHLTWFKFVGTDEVEFQIHIQYAYKYKYIY